MGQPLLEPAPKDEGAEKVGGGRDGRYSDVEEFL